MFLVLSTPSTNLLSEPRVLNSKAQQYLPSVEYFQENCAGVEVDDKLFIIPPQLNKQISLKPFKT